MGIYSSGNRFNEVTYKLEADLENDVVSNSKIFFGSNSIYIDAKRKIESKSIGGSIPDGFLFDWSDKENPNFYIVEVELASHDFFGHIFPQITKFFAFFNNRKSQDELSEKIYTIINTDAELKKQFQKNLGDKEIYKFVKDTISNNQNILIVIDGEKKELPEIMETYSETWGSTVKILTLKKYSNHEQSFFLLEPDFENIEYSVIGIEEKEDVSKKKEYTENEVTNFNNPFNKEIYGKIKSELTHRGFNVLFNPTKYYISIIKNKRLALFQFNKELVKLVVMKDYADVQPHIQHHPIKVLSEPVQKFWNHPSCEIQINNNQNLHEIVDLLDLLINEAN